MKMREFAVCVEFCSEWTVKLRIEADSHHDALLKGVAEASKVMQEEWAPENELNRKVHDPERITAVRFVREVQNEKTR